MITLAGSDWCLTDACTMGFKEWAVGVGVCVLFGVLAGLLSLKG